VAMRSRASGRSRPSSVSPPLPIIDSSDIDSDIASCIDPESIELIVTESDSNGFWGLDDFHRAVVCARPSDLPVSSVVDETNFLRQVQVGNHIHPWYFTDLDQYIVFQTYLIRKVFMFAFVLLFHSTHLLDVASGAAL